MRGDIAIPCEHLQEKFVHELRTLLVAGIRSRVHLLRTITHAPLTQLLRRFRSKTVEHMG